MAEQNYIYYGTSCSSQEVENLLHHLIETNRRAESEERKKAPLCIWERHGIGKKLVPPDWVPKTKGPGFLMIDDVNRADDMILRGIMQLLQNYELVSWSSFINRSWWSLGVSRVKYQ